MTADRLVSRLRELAQYVAEDADGHNRLVNAREMLDLAQDIESAALARLQTVPGPGPDFIPAPAPEPQPLRVPRAFLSQLVEFNRKRREEDMTRPPHGHYK